MAALANVPVANVTATFDSLMKLPPYIENEIIEITNYFEDTWIERPTRRGGCRQSVFKIAL